MYSNGNLVISWRDGEVLMRGKSLLTISSRTSSLSCTTLEARAWRTKSDTDDSTGLLSGKGVRNLNMAWPSMTSPIEVMIDRCSRDTWVNAQSDDDVGPRYATILQNSSRGREVKHASDGCSSHWVGGRGRHPTRLLLFVLIILQLINLGGTILHWW